jgi:hypothetical protein
MALTAGHLLVIGKGRLIADTSAEEFTRSGSQRSVHVRSPQAAELAARCLQAGAAVRAGTDPDVIEITEMDSAEAEGWPPPVASSCPSSSRQGLAGGGVHGTDPRQRGVPGGGGDP